MVKIAVLGASGYTGAEFVRYALKHPSVQISALIAHSQAGQSMAQVYPQFLGADLPDLITVDDFDPAGVDCLVLCLPHTKSQEIVARFWDRYPDLKFLDLAADFRLDDPQLYGQVYQEHLAPDLQPHAVYGLPMINAQAIAQSRLVACPGCFPTGALSVLLPLAQRGLVQPDGAIVDSKTGVTGAGRKVAQSFLYPEVADGIHAYGVANHRHGPEMEQELSKAIGGAAVRLTFTPHLTPMSRGILSTIYVNLADNHSAQEVQQALRDLCASTPFFHYAENSVQVATRFVRGTNRVVMTAAADRVPGRVILLSAIDNLARGSSGQAMQNLNLMFGFDQLTGLEETALFP